MHPCELGSSAAEVAPPYAPRPWGNEVLQAACHTFRCDVWARRQPPDPSMPASAAELSLNGHELILDGFDWVHRVTGKKAKCLAMLDVGSGLPLALDCKRRKGSARTQAWGLQKRVHHGTLGWVGHVWYVQILMAVSFLRSWRLGSISKECSSSRVLWMRNGKWVKWKWPSNNSRRLSRCFIRKCWMGSLARVWNSGGRHFPHSGGERMPVANDPGGLISDSPTL